MKKFSEMGIKPSSAAFTGDKIKMAKLFNREIQVIGYRIEPSKFKDKRLAMQISLNGTLHVVFTGSTSLMDMIERVALTDFPFVTTIVKENERYEFT